LIRFSGLESTDAKTDLDPDNNKTGVLFFSLRGVVVVTEIGSPPPVIAITPPSGETELSDPCNGTDKATDPPCPNPNTWI
jgi:hypothetical protein